MHYKHIVYVIAISMIKKTANGHITNNYINIIYNTRYTIYIYKVNIANIFIWLKIHCIISHNQHEWIHKRYYNAQTKWINKWITLLLWLLLTFETTFLSDCVLLSSVWWPSAVSSLPPILATSIGSTPFVSASSNCLIKISIRRGDSRSKMLSLLLMNVDRSALAPCESSFFKRNDMARHNC